MTIGKLYFILVDKGSSCISSFDNSIKSLDYLGFIDFCVPRSSGSVSFVFVNGGTGKGKKVIIVAFFLVYYTFIKVINFISIWAVGVFINFTGFVNDVVIIFFKLKSHSCLKTFPF